MIFLPLFRLERIEDAASDAADDVAPGVHGVELGPRQHTLSGLRFCLLPSLLGTPGRLFSFSFDTDCNRSISIFGFEVLVFW